MNYYLIYYYYYFLEVKIILLLKITLARRGAQLLCRNLSPFRSSSSSRVWFGLSSARRLHHLCRHLLNTTASMMTAQVTGLIFVWCCSFLQREHVHHETQRALV